MALTDMYPGKSNSPKTTLKNDITASATTITVVDSSVLPPAPNLMVIGSNEQSEVVIYGGKNGNVLTQCIRGAGGTQKSIWIAGVNVSRNFTNLDYEILCNNVRDLDSRKRNVEDKINVGTEVTSILNVENGGTGQSSLSGVKSWIGLKALAYKAIVALATDVSGILSVENGGTGVSSLNALRNALGLGNDTTKVLQPANGGTGQSSLQSTRNAMGLGNTTGALPIANGGTGKTTAADAWTALGGGAIGKKASLAASDIPNLSTDKLTSGALPIARGGTGKTTAADAWTALGGGAIGKKASLAASDIPAISTDKLTSGTLPLERGGTGQTSLASLKSALGIGGIAGRPNYTISNVNLTPGSSSLSNNVLYFYYE